MSEYEVLHVEEVDEELMYFIRYYPCSESRGEDIIISEYELDNFVINKVEI